MTVFVLADDVVQATARLFLPKEEEEARPLDHWRHHPDGTYVTQIPDMYRNLGSLCVVRQT